jgi:hypothetical protein
MIEIFINQTKIFVVIVFSIITNSIFCQTYNIVSDGIYPNIISCNTQSKLKEYYLFHNLRISNYYKIIDSCSTNDSSSYEFLILSPISQEFGIDTLPCDVEIGKRLLVAIKKIGGNYAIVFINENAIPNTFEYQSDPFHSIKYVTSNYIKLKIFTGSIIKCSYEYVFTKKNKAFELYKITYDCYKTDLSKNERKEIKFKNRIPLSNFKINELLIEPNIE